MLFLKSMRNVLALGVCEAISMPVRISSKSRCMQLVSFYYSSNSVPKADSDVEWI